MLPPKENGKSQGGENEQLNGNGDYIRAVGLIRGAMRSWSL